MRFGKPILGLPGSAEEHPAKVHGLDPWNIDASGWFYYFPTPQVYAPGVKLFDGSHETHLSRRAM
jgi:hypothetical protein